MIAGRQQLHHGIERRESRPEREAVETALERGDIALECLARGIARAGVLEALVAPQAFLDVGGSLINGAHDGPTQGIAQVPGMHGACRKAAR